MRGAKEKMSARMSRPVAVERSIRPIRISRKCSVGIAFNDEVHTEQSGLAGWDDDSYAYILRTETYAIESEKGFRLDRS
jgi:hypothetical protein